MIPQWMYVVVGALVSAYTLSVPWTPTKKGVVYYYHPIPRTTFRTTTSRTAPVILMPPRPHAQHTPQDIRDTRDMVFRQHVEHPRQEMIPTWAPWIGAETIPVEPSFAIAWQGVPHRLEAPEPHAHVAEPSWRPENLPQLHAVDMSSSDDDDDAYAAVLTSRRTKSISHV